MFFNLFLAAFSFFSLFYPSSNTVHYKSFTGIKYEMRPIEGYNISLLIPEEQYQSLTEEQFEAIGEIVGALDNAWYTYYDIIGFSPKVGKLHKRKPVVAVVDHADHAAARGNLGYTGIEIQKEYFDILLKNYIEQKTFDQVLFYEMGRNYFLFNDQIPYEADPVSHSFITGFAVYMRFYVMDKMGIKGAPFNQFSWAEFKNKVYHMVDEYLDDPDTTFENTIGADGWTNYDGLGSTDLFASFLMRLNEYYGDEFTNTIWKVMRDLPKAATNQDKIDNFVTAASLAAGEDLKPLFLSWRWPVDEYQSILDGSGAN